MMPPKIGKTRTRCCLVPNFVVYIYIYTYVGYQTGSARCCVVLLSPKNMFEHVLQYECRTSHAVPIADDWSCLRHKKPGDITSV